MKQTGASELLQSFVDMALKGGGDGARGRARAALEVLELLLSQGSCYRLQRSEPLLRLLIDIYAELLFGRSSYANAQEAQAAISHLLAQDWHTFLATISRDGKLPHVAALLRDALCKDMLRRRGELEPDFAERSIAWIYRQVLADSTPSQSKHDLSNVIRKDFIRKHFATAYAQFLANHFAEQPAQVWEASAFLGLCGPQHIQNIVVALDELEGLKTSDYPFAVVYMLASNAWFGDRAVGRIWQIPPVYEGEDMKDITREYGSLSPDEEAAALALIAYVKERIKGFNKQLTSHRKRRTLEGFLAQSRFLDDDMEERLGDPLLYQALVDDVRQHLSRLQQQLQDVMASKLGTAELARRAKCDLYPGHANPFRQGTAKELELVRLGLSQLFPEGIALLDARLAEHSEAFKALWAQDIQGEQEAKEPQTWFDALEAHAEVIASARAYMCGEVLRLSPRAPKDTKGLS